MKIAIIGASIGQKALYEKTKELGIESIGFAWLEGAICRDLADKFYPISITEIDEIVRICKEEQVDGVVSNASEFTANIVSIIAERLNFIGNPPEVLHQIQNKYFCRRVTKGIKGLSSVDAYIYDGGVPEFPCIVKPVTGGGKRGVSFATNEEEFLNAIQYVHSATDSDVLIENFIVGREISVESLSFKGDHYVIQITDKETTGAPHFVEIGHHEPSSLPIEIKNRIKQIVPQILSKIGLLNGPSHIEFKIDKEGNVYLIEVNPRGGGGEISSQLVQLSTGFDYIKAIIDIALGKFSVPDITENKYSGIYFLCEQTKDYLSFFKQTDYQPWLSCKNIKSYNLSTLKTNKERDSYIVYQWCKRITPDFDNFCVRLLDRNPEKHKLAKEFQKNHNMEAKFQITDDWLNKILKLADILYVFQDNKIVGWFVLYCNNYETRVAYGAGLYVLEAYRKQKIGEKLTQMAIQLCQQRNFKFLTFYCNNPIALKLYLKLGFYVKRQERVPSLGNKLYDFLCLDL